MTARIRYLYSLPAFVLAFPTIPVFVLLPSFYAKEVGLGLAQVGIILLVLRIFDVISDPVLGWISDHIPARWGKRKLPMAIGGLIGAPALWALFNPPADAGPAWLVIWGFLLFTAWTAIQIPYLAWAAELEPDYHKRTRLNATREAMGLGGIMIIALVGVALADLSMRDRFSLIAIFTILAGIGTFLLSLRLVPEGRIARNRHGWTLPYKNQLFLRLLSAWFLNGFANALPAICLPLYVQYVLGSNVDNRPVFLALYFSFALAGIPFWLWLAKKTGKHRTWAGSMLFACAVFTVVPFLGDGDMVLFAIICALTGLALGADLALPPSIQADCADWDRWRFGQERLAGLYAWWSMATKLALGLAAGFAFPVLDWAGLGTGGIWALPALILIYAGFPIVLKLVVIAMIWRFPLGPNQHRALRRALEKTA